MSDLDHEATGRRQADDIIIRLEQKLESLIEKVDRMSEAFLGDGTKENPGVMIRLDRVERWQDNKDQESSRAWQWRIGLAVPIVILIVERAFYWFSLFRKVANGG